METITYTHIFFSLKYIGLHSEEKSEHKMFQSHAFFSAYWQCSNCLFIYSGHYHQMGNKTIGQIVDVIHILLNYMEANYIIYCTYGSYIHINTEKGGSKSIQSLSHIAE